MRKHALLSPSGAKRWLTCTPSAMLESKLPETTSVYADEGTLAHALSELMILYRLHRITEGQFQEGLLHIEQDELYRTEMYGYCEDYALFVLTKLSEARVMTRDADIYTEEQIDLSEYIPDGFGHLDITIMADYMMWIIDLKYGQGVPVYAENNDQLMCYALGAWIKYGMLYDVKQITMIIYQPRLDNISEWSISVEDLMIWTKDVLVPGALAASKGQGEYVPGSHCQFCKAKPTCKALKDYAFGAYQPAQIPGTITPQEVADVLNKAALIKNWLGAVEEYALQQSLRNGVKWPGYKVVNGRSNRKIIDPAKANLTLYQAGYLPTQYLNMDLKGIGDLEKLTGKRQFAALLSEYIVKPAGSPTLVPVSDPRPELNNAAEAFAGIVIDED